jgi:hypothetical protein
MHVRTRSATGQAFATECNGIAIRRLAGFKLQDGALGAERLEHRQVGPQPVFALVWFHIS